MAIFDKNGLLNRMIQLIRSAGINGKTSAQNLRDFLTDLIDSTWNLFGQSSSTNPDLAWAPSKTYNLTDNKYAIHQLRIFESKIDNNYNHQPPTAPNSLGKYEDAYWKEVSEAPRSAIADWEAGTIVDEGLFIVHYNDKLLRLDAPRPFNTVNVVTEIGEGKWKVLGGESGGGAGTFNPVQDIAALKAINTANEEIIKDKWAIIVEDEGAWYRFDRESAAAESLPSIVAPTTGTGRWIKMGSAALTPEQEEAIEDVANKVDKVNGDNQLEVTPTTPPTWLSSILTGGKALLRPILNKIVEQIATKADKITGGTNGNLVKQDSNGNIAPTTIPSTPLDIYNVPSDVKMYLENNVNWTGDALVISHLSNNGKKGNRYTSFTTGYTYECVEDVGTWARYPLNLRTVNILTMLAAEKTKLETAANWNGVLWKGAVGGGQDLSTDSTGKIHFNGTHFFWVIDNNTPLRLGRV
jgi:hypothetical protein